jgi:hypothetical protein
MAFPWTKKELGHDDAPGAAGETAEAPSLAELAGRLGQLEAALHEVGQQVVCYLAKRPAASESSAASPLDEQLSAILARLEKAAAASGEASSNASLQTVLDRLATIEAKLASPATGDAAGTERVLASLHAALAKIDQNTSRGIEHVEQRVAAGLAELTGYLRPPAADDQPPAGAAEWQRAILGRSLAEHPELAAVRQKLIAEVLEGRGPAMAFAGQLLVFQSAPPEKMSAQLKEIGEAFYRWQPKTRSQASVLEEALVSWLLRACDDAGLPNTIELVSPGERFDAGRHSASERGVEIAQVMGWVVLRDNGRVYTKALVSVK